MYLHITCYKVQCYMYHIIVLVSTYVTSSDTQRTICFIARIDRRKYIFKVLFGFRERKKMMIKEEIIFSCFSEMEDLVKF